MMLGGNFCNILELCIKNFLHLIAPATVTTFLSKGVELVKIRLPYQLPLGFLESLNDIFT